MKQTTRKICSILLCGLLGGTAFSAVGCGRNEAEEPVEEGATVVKIMMREFETWRNDHFESMKRKFNSNLEDGLQIEVEYVIEENFNDRLQSAREAGEAPDIILHSYNHIYTQMENGNIAPLNEYISAEAIGDITDVVKEAIEFDGKTYAYPWYTEASTVLFYSKSKFAEAGIEKAPATWAEMLAACEKLKPTMKKGTYALGMPLGGDIGWVTWGMTYNQLGSWPLSANWDKSVFDNDVQKVNDFSRLLDYYGDIYDNNYAPVSAVHMNGYNEIISAWAEGKYAMTLAVSSQLGTLIQEYPDKVSDLGMAVMPTETGNQDLPTATNGGWCFCIDAKSSKKTEAGKVIEGLMFTDKEKNAEFYEMSGYSRYSALKSIAAINESKAKESEYKEFGALIGDVCSKAVMEPIYTWNVSLQICWAFENMIQGDVPSTKQLTLEVHDKITDIIRVQQLAGKNPHYKGE